MNGASILGRTIPNFLADIIGPFNNFVPACLGPGIMLFALLGIRSTAGIVVFAIIYGFFTGACACACLLFILNSLSFLKICVRSGAVVSLLAPTIATLTANKGEIGCVRSCELSALDRGRLTLRQAADGRRVLPNVVRVSVRHACAGRPVGDHLPMVAAHHLQCGEQRV